MLRTENLLQPVAVSELSDSEALSLSGPDRAPGPEAEQCGEHWRHCIMITVPQRPVAGPGDARAS